MGELAGSACFLVCLIREDNVRAKVYATRDLDKSLRNFHDRKVVALPVAILFGDPAVAGPALKVNFPQYIPIGDAAKHFGMLRLAPEGQAALHRHLHRLGPAAVPLFRRWRFSLVQVGRQL